MLGDSFLNDLDDLGDSEEEEESTQDVVNNIISTNKSHQYDKKEEGDDDDDASDAEEMDHRDEIEAIPIVVYGQLGISTLRNNTMYQSHMKRIQNALDESEENSKLNNIPNSLSSIVNKVKDDADYKLVMDCNKVIHEIEENINNTTKYISDIYSKKFPELESLIPNKQDYIKTIERIGNEVDMTLIDLNDILPSALVMIVSVTGSTSNSMKLSQDDIDICYKGCQVINKLYNDKELILKFVECKMHKIAPNMCSMIGTFLCAQLIGLTNGLIALSQIPSSNIPVIGQEKKNLAGFSRLSSLPNTGILYYCDLVQNCPPNLRRKALKAVGSKLSIAIRCDAYSNHPDGSTGKKLKDEIIEKFEKLNEPPKARTKKALPIPEEKKRSKRGGKRVRKFKERFAMTELRAQQNRMKMSADEGEYSESAMGAEYSHDASMVGSKDTGKLRAPVRKEVKLSNNKKLKMTASASSGQTNGLSSSLVFTPVQGLELVNPNAAADRVKEANNKWFNANSGFLSAIPK